MSQEQEQHQQQILFSDRELSDAKQEASIDEEQVLFDNSAWLPVEHAIEQADDDINNFQLIAKPRWLWRITIGLIFALIVIELIEFFTLGFQQSPLVTSLYGLILVGLSLICGSALLREFTGLRRLKQLQKMQVQADEIINDDKVVDINAFCQNISDHLPNDLVSEQEQQWQDILLSEHDQSELLQLYSKVMLTKVDQRAMAEIVKFSSEAVVMVALSPIALLDMLLILWRNLRMVNKVSSIYGIQLGYWGRLKLMRMIFTHMIYAGTSELAVDFSAQVLGADLLTKFSTRLAQGAGAGMLTIRLGLMVMKLSRPIPFQQQAPKISDMSKLVLKQLKEVVKSRD